MCLFEIILKWNIDEVSARRHVANHIIVMNRHNKIKGPVVQSVVSLTSSLRVISLTVLADSMHNILIFFAEKM